MPVELVWTALPDGRSDDGLLRLSAHVAPRLTVPGGWTSSLGDEPDFADLLTWPPPDVHFEVSFGGSTVEARIVSEVPDSDLWRTVFPPETPVRSFGVPDLTDTPIHTYPFAKLAEWLEHAYAQLAAVSPSEHPTFATLDQVLGLRDLNLTAGRAALERRAEAEDWLRGWLAETRVVDTRNASDLTQDVFQLEDFFAPAPVDPEVEFATPPETPDPDLHQGVAFVGQHRRLQRLLGLVFDLEVDEQVPVGPTTVQVFAHWSPSVPTDERHPQTACEVRDDGFLAAPSTYRMADGHLALESVDLYRVVAVDVDGAVLKLGDLAGNAERKSLHRTVDTPETSPVPALRVGGIVVAEPGHAAHLGDRLSRALDLDAGIAHDPPLYAEDITRGYRVDVQDVDVGPWRSLMQRHATYHFPDLDRTEVADDEGVVSAPIARRPGADDLYVGEELCTWDGWSLVASRPGRILDDPEAAHPLTDDPDNPAGATFRVSIGASVTPGTLPLLRVGRTYRVRMRTVDLANNSVLFDEHGDDTHASPEVAYGRLEPVATPPVLLRTPPGPGASVEHVVLRSDLAGPPSPPTAERHLVVPKVGQQTVEDHGAIDVLAPDGSGLRLPDGSPARWHQLAARDAATLANHPDASPLPAEDDEEPATAYDVAALKVTWSPDPLARGFRLAFLDGPHAGEILHEVLVPEGADWPGDWAVRLVVVDGPGSVTFDGASGVVTVPLAKGEATHARLSSVLEPGDVRSLGLWRWLRSTVSSAALPTLEERIVAGEHWMVTPFRTLRLVHAVRQPIATPEFAIPPSPARPYGGTHALLRGELAFSRRSTGRVDLVADWSEPVDEGPGSDLAPDVTAPWSRQRNAVAFSLDIEHGDEFDPTSEAFVGRHEFGDSKHRMVTYHAVATTLFLEQFAGTDTFPSDGPGSTVVLPTGGQAIVARTLRLRWRDGDTTRKVDEGTYTLDPETGQVTFGDGVSGAVPPAGTMVRATYTTDPVTRVTADPPEGSGPQLVSIQATVRPAAPVLRYALPTFSWSRTEDMDQGGELRRIDSQRRGGGLRLYLERPWWSSGEGELLGVLVWPGATGGGDLGDKDPLKGYVSEWGEDPVYAARPLPSRYPRMASFPGAAASTGVRTSLKETRDDSAKGVFVAGHEVRFDADRDLWYCDVEVDVGDAYTPFLRLALARWQPSALPHAQLSPVVLAEFVQPAPDRLVTVYLDQTDQASLRVSLAGPAPASTQAATGPGVARVTVERLVYPERGALGWEPVGKPIALQAGGTRGEGVWSSVVPLPASVDHRDLRLVVEQFERLHAEPVRPLKTANPWAPSTVERLVHTDIVLLAGRSRQ